MTEEQHKRRHALLHRRFDELLADFYAQTGRVSAETTLAQFMDWSARQCASPSTKQNIREALAAGLDLPPAAGLDLPPAKDLVAGSAKDLVEKFGLDLAFVFAVKGEDTRVSYHGVDVPHQMLAVGLTIAMTHKLESGQVQEAVHGVLDVVSADVAHNAKLLLAQQRIADLEKWIADLKSGCYVNCVYCGYRYGDKSDTPVAYADVLKQHIAACPGHPMSELLKCVQQAADVAFILLQAPARQEDTQLRERLQPLLDRCTAAIAAVNS